MLFVGDAYDPDDDELEKERDGAMASDVCHGGRDPGPCFHHAELVPAIPAD